ncbi:family 16 glycoside hydrolase [Planctomycetes bacterium K23_9]|uniref:3-keto-disaccharide hydrolase domain-containing protein n=1 Tax=Stieleria marina TaxID=1930275 RepID=A0A517NVA4_9BACT|nr:hypothetical protein K239x_30440 [Planctomycetes bacterium K23_9]
MTIKPLLVLLTVLVLCASVLLPVGSATADDVATQTAKPKPQASEDRASEDKATKDKASENKATDDSSAKAKSAKKLQWTDLTGQWEKCQFGGDGEIEIGKKKISLDYGDPITGVRWAGDVVRDNYEIEMEGRRVDGFDFFCALTFPVGEKGRASLVMGGWGGGTMGISSIDDRDASDNDTTMYRDFKNNQWYKARVRVEESRIAVWIDDTLQFEQPRDDHKFDIRYEMDPCLPLGLANFQCKSEMRNLRVRKLKADELGQPLKSKKPAAEEDDAKSGGEAK